MRKPESQSNFHFEDSDSKPIKQDIEPGEEECSACGNPIRNMSCNVCRTKYLSTVKYQQKLAEQRKNPYKTIVIKNEPRLGSIEHTRRKNIREQQGVVEFKPKHLPQDVKNKITEDVRIYQEKHKEFVNKRRAKNKKDIGGHDSQK